MKLINNLTLMQMNGMSSMKMYTAMHKRKIEFLSYQL